MSIYISIISNDTCILRQYISIISNDIWILRQYMSIISNDIWILFQIISINAIKIVKKFSYFTLIFSSTKNRPANSKFLLLNMLKHLMPLQICLLLSHYLLFSKSFFTFSESFFIFFRIILYFFKILFNPQTQLRNPCNYL